LTYARGELLAPQRQRVARPNARGLPDAGRAHAERRSGAHRIAATHVNLEIVCVALGQFAQELVAEARLADAGDGGHQDDARDWLADALLDRRLEIRQL